MDHRPKYEKNQTFRRHQAILTASSTVTKALNPKRNN